MPSEAFLRILARGNLGESLHRPGPQGHLVAGPPLPGSGVGWVFTAHGQQDLVVAGPEVEVLAAWQLALDLHGCSQAGHVCLPSGLAQHGAGILESLSGTRPSDGFIYSLLARAAKAVRDDAVDRLLLTFREPP